MSVEVMMACIQGADGDELIHKGQALMDAKDEIERIGNDLKGHVTRTTWDGEGGTAFHEWGDDFAKQVLKLANFSGVAGKYMRQAGSDLKTAIKALPPIPEGTMGQCFADADKEKARVEALDKVRGQVAEQMQRIASSYRASTWEIKGAELPRLPGPPDTIMPISSDSEAYGASGGRSGGTSGGAYGGAVSTPSHGSFGGSASSGGHGTVSAGHQSVDSPSGTGSVNVPSSPGHIDRVPLPDNIGTNIDGTTTPTAPPVPSNVGTLPPPTSAGPGGTPPLVTPPMGPMTPNLGGGPRTVGGGATRMPPTAGGTGKFGTGPISGSIRPNIPRADTGIIGGMPSHGQPGAPGARGVPRGTVIGGESQPTGRGMAGGGMPGGGMRSGAGGSGYAGGTRRLVSEPGGVVGGPRGSQGARRDFTPGGAGLVRDKGTSTGNGGLVGGPPRAGQRSSDQQRDGAGVPDYLTEDEETWSTGGHNAVPPVIE
ncbi:hypothetical protein BLA24_22940 [Streptomyces cinnamoneus]|uniref:WXG100 family type VII secretion target n=1 Tax=Streptomyces cinnamoneus TaxID=53446 RepID=A0A2G1XCP7_STRCJ|nr:hypothetical protein [Streptomyces cinnamoneus]PHQ48965.1 hypothetical protein BLA24_22940 [Streptomyces cinnamoneus]PPT15390.1 hypothetical protein CYQ11_23135 [Streptomyces cinnamoneus]